VSGNCAQHQRDVALAIKTARELALLPYTQRTTSDRPSPRGPGRGGRGAPAPDAPGAPEADDAATLDGELPEDEDLLGDEDLDVEELVLTPGAEDES
jgi:hypothetical protein